MIDVKNLTYIFPDSTVGVHPTTFNLPTGSRTLLIGANGAGKSTILRVLAGKTLAKAGSVTVHDRDPFRDGDAGITYLGTEWAGNPIVRHDIPVTLLLSSIGGDTWTDRRDLLIDILDIDLRWHMHAVSDGERRRVQLAMGLLRPWNTLLLDEVTVDLDVLVRARLLEFLRLETETRSCTIVSDIHIFTTVSVVFYTNQIYATHIFDGLTDWPTHLVHMHLGKVLSVNTYEHYLDEAHAKGVETPTLISNGFLLQLALAWLKQDLLDRGLRQAKPTWDQIASSVEGEPLEHFRNEAFERYFRMSRARD